MQFNVSLLNEWIQKQGRGAVKQLHERTGYSLASIAYLRTRASVPTSRYLVRIAEVIGCDPQELIVFTTPKARRKPKRAA